MTLYVALVLIFNTDPGPPIETYAFTAALLLPVAAWMTVSVLGVEDAPLAAATAAAVGGPTRLRLAKFMFSILLAVPLVVLAISMPPILRNYTATLSADAVAAGLVAHLLAMLAGAAAAPLLASPVVERAGISFLGITTITLVELLVPHSPPVRELLKYFYDGAAHHFGDHLALVAVETLVLAGLLATVGTLAARRTS
jgi:hypothetical protein